MGLLIFVTFLFGGALGALPECPPKEDVFPCSCDRNYYGTENVISCADLDHLYTVIPVLKNTRSQQFSFYFKNSRLGNIPSDFFEGQQFTHLSFSNSQVGSFGSRPFSGLENTLKILDIVGSVHKSTQDFKALPLGHLKQLEFVIFSYNAIKKVGNDWFKGGLEKLRTLYLHANGIDELGDQVFSSLVSVESIILNHNPIKKVSRSMFPCPAKLKVLFLSICGIEELPEDIFEYMPDLNAVDLSGNRLKTIPYATWGEIWDQLHYVNFDNNDLECDYRLKWIYRQKLPASLQGSCGGSNRLSGRKLSELRSEDFD